MSTSFSSSNEAELLFHLDDQTDEDFFDRLEDDDFEIYPSISKSHAADTANLDDIGNSSVDGSAFSFGSDDLHETPLVASQKVEDSSVSILEKKVTENVTTVQENISVIAPTKPLSIEKAVPFDEVLLDSLGSSSIGNNTKVGSPAIKEVQWSAFPSVVEQPQFDGFGTTNFFTEDSSGFSEKVTSNVVSNGGSLEEIVGTDSSVSWFGLLEQQQASEVWVGNSEQNDVKHSNSSQQQDGQLASSQEHNDQAGLDTNDPLYWDKLYYGWKYDFSAGQWYQVNNGDSIANAQFGDSETACVHAQESTQLGFDNAQVYKYDSSPSINTQMNGSENAAFPHSQERSQFKMQLGFDNTQDHNSSPNINTKMDGSETAFVHGQENSQSKPQLGFDNTQIYSYDTIPNMNTQLNGSETAVVHAQESTTHLNAKKELGLDTTLVYNYDSNPNNNTHLNGYGTAAVYSEESPQDMTLLEHDNAWLVTGNGIVSDQSYESSYLEQTSQSVMENVSEVPSVHDENKIPQGTMGYPQNMVFDPQYPGWYYDTNIQQWQSLESYSQYFQTTTMSQNQLTSGGNAISDSYFSESLSDQCYNNGNSNAVQGFIPTQNLYPNVEHSQSMLDTSHNYYTNQKSGSLSHSQFSYSPMETKSSVGRPSHALVAFGFGGKLVIMKNSKKNTLFGTSATYGNLDTGGVTVSLLNLMDVIMEKNDSSDIGLYRYDYFESLCKKSFPGPLVGGNASSKDLNKWIDERIADCHSSNIDFTKGEQLRCILSLLKISLQYYGKLRSPFGTDPSLLESDSPESAVTKLFASTRKDATQLREHSASTHCMHDLPTEGQIQETVVKVQTLLLSGKRKEALHCAQEGMLWGPALVLGAQLGEKFYINTIKKMADRQFVSGSPLRTLCLLIAGQPADVFSDGGLSNSFTNKRNAVPQQSGQVPANSMLDDWEDNLAMICANRTKDDELVIVHLGDCLWKERVEINAAHSCYLVAEPNFESYSNSARLCLLSADHWNCPRTYATPEAIQMTEFYEYTKVLGNSQFHLPTFQPYKLIYAYMLAEVGNVSYSLKYCQTIQKLLKNHGRSIEVEICKVAASSLEERLQMHQQGGYGTNMAPGKLVDKLFTTIDKSIQSMIGAPPSPLLPMPESKMQGNGYDSFSTGPKVSGSQSTMAMPSLMPSTPAVATNDRRQSAPNRSVSMPNFGRSHKEEQGSPSNGAKPTDVKTEPSSNSRASSRLLFIGSSFLQKSLTWVSRGRYENQAKLGQENKFYYDEKLKRWVEEGAEPPSEEASAPPPPTNESFQNGASDYNIDGALKTQKSPTLSRQNSGIPSIPPCKNHLLGHRQMGVRSRYVDTFNKGASGFTNSFQAPSAQSVKKPMTIANFFIPTTSVTTIETKEDATEKTLHEASSNEDLSSPPPPIPLQRYPSADHSSPSRNNIATMGTQSGNNPPLTIHSRAASWSGSVFDPSKHLKTLGLHASLDELHPSSSLSHNFSQFNGGGSSTSRDDLHECLA